ncbi:Uncharacterised protein [uncultured archaeon]|nr:Uncharacterised protein [uncultured archaeon]
MTLPAAPRASEAITAPSAHSRAIPAPASREAIPPSIQSAWDSLATTLLGTPLGPLEDYVPYMEKYVKPIRQSRSSLSHTPVFVSDEYPPGARFISCDEMGQYDQQMAAQPLDLNDLKDLDSAAQASRERLQYAGNIVLGQCSGVSFSNRVVDSHNVLCSSDVWASKNIAYCFIAKECESLFGSPSVSVTKYGIKNFESWKDSRVMETMRVYESIDCYFSANLENCADCLFCFNLRSKQRCIGNRPFSKDEFASLKKKLLEDIADELKRKKSLPSIVDLIGAPMPKSG